MFATVKVMYKAYDLTASSTELPACTHMYNICTHKYTYYVHICTTMCDVTAINSDHVTSIRVLMPHPAPKTRVRAINTVKIRVRV